MIPKSLSPTSIEAYENCPARWKASVIDWTPDVGSKAASLGTTCHEAIENFLVNEYYLTVTDPAERIAVMTKLYDAAYGKHMTDRKQYKEGLAMVLRWLERTSFHDRTVVSVEVKHTFQVATTAGEIPFNCKFDRLDVLDEDGEVEVVDLKTIARPIAPEELREKIQARCYAVAAQLLYPNAPRVRVTFDLLRHDPVSVVFSKEENRETYRYIKEVAQRIVDDNVLRPTLGPDCKWCVIRHKCDELQKHVKAGGPLSITDPNEAARKKYEVEAAIKGLEAMKDDLDRVVLDHCDANEIGDFTTPDGWKVSLTASKRRFVDPRVKGILDPAFVLARGDLSVTDLDELLESGALDDEKASMVRQMIGVKIGKTSVKVKPPKGPK